MKLTTGFHLVLRLEVSGTIHLLPLYAFMLWTGTTLHFTSAPQENSGLIPQIMCFLTGQKRFRGRDREICTVQTAIQAPQILLQPPAPLLFCRSFRFTCWQPLARPGLFFQISSARYSGELTLCRLTTWPASSWWGSGRSARPERGVGSSWRMNSRGIRKVQCDQQNELGNASINLFLGTCT